MKARCNIYVLLAVLLLFLGISSCEQLFENQSSSVVVNLTKEQLAAVKSDLDSAATGQDEAEDEPASATSKYISPLLEMFPTFRHNILTIEEVKPLPPSVCKRADFIKLVTEKYHGFTTIEEAAAMEHKDIICVPRNITDNSTLHVQLVNSTTLLTILGNKTNTNGQCTVVLFFAPWCMFCAKIAPYYNALARAFPQLNILAIESAHFTSLNTRYGTISVPNILLFYNNSKGIARFNHTDRTFETFTAFVKNITGFVPDSNVEVLPEDYDGPLPSIRSDEQDWLLWLSWVFVVVFFISVFIKSTLGQNIINAMLNFGVEHHHID